MPTNNVSVLHGLRLNSGVFIGQLTDATPETNVDELTAFSSGYPDPMFQGAFGSKPDIPFTSTQLQSILNACTATFAADLSSNTDLYYKHAKDLGVRDPNASTVHQRFRVSQSIMYWTELTLAQNQLATITVRLLPTYDGTNAPLIPAGTLALVGTELANEMFTLGPVYVNDTLVNGVNSVRVPLGVVMIEEPTDGEGSITFAAVAQRTPIVELSSLEVGLWNTYGAGLPVTALRFFARRLKPDTPGPYANSDPSHIKFTAAAGIASVINTSGSGNTPTRTTLRVRPRIVTPGDSILTFATGQEIS